MAVVPVLIARGVGGGSAGLALGIDAAGNSDPAVSNRIDRVAGQAGGRVGETSAEYERASVAASLYGRTGDDWAAAVAHLAGAAVDASEMLDVLGARMRRTVSACRTLAVVRWRPAAPPPPPPPSQPASATLPPPPPPSSTRRPGHRPHGPRTWPSSTPLRPLARQVRRVHRAPRLPPLPRTARPPPPPHHAP